MTPHETFVLVSREGRYLAKGCKAWTMAPSRARIFRSRAQADAQAQRFYGARVESTERAND